MKRLNRYHVLPALALLLFGAVLGVQFDSYITEDDALQQYKKLKSAFAIITNRYVDEVESGDIAEEGVKGMLKSLDPHSSYIPPKRVKDTRDRYKGSFGGIGILFEAAGSERDTARVISPVADGPSEKVGIMAGDRIVEIEDSSAIGLSATEIQDRLKGRIGTEVSLTVYRPLSDKRLTFTITRDEIPLYSINSSYMVDDETGYIEIGRFAMSTYDEFMKKVDQLKGEGMDRLVLDLRSNPGGVMKSAVQIADEMLGRPGLTIVKTKGRRSSMNQTLRSQAGGTLSDQPVIVLVDGQSASASEILAGALQDHDRALLVGRRTFGKALVQKQFELNDGSLLQMTVGRYYTPAGRLIQTPYEKGNRKQYYENKSASWRDAVYNVRKYKDSIPDSLTYQTEHGRTVFGGGGILPDYVVQPDTTSLATFIRGSQLDAIFAQQWFSKHEQQLRSTWQDRQGEFVSSYRVPDEAVSSFWDYAEEEGVLTLTNTPDSVDASERVYLEAKAQETRDVVQSRVKGRLANELYGTGAGQSILNKTDPAVQEAMSLWPSSEELAGFHAASAGVKD
jgi:carboxyl-terminal processing protease